MNMPGSIRQKRELAPCRFVVTQASRLLFALPDGTACPGPEAHHSGLGSLFISSLSICTAPGSVPAQRRFSSYTIRVERNFPRVTRSNFHE